MSSNFVKKIITSAFVRNINILIDKSGGPVAFSRLIDANYYSVLHWKKGDNLPDGKTLLKIHERCGVSLDWLLIGEERLDIKCPYCGDWPGFVRQACEEVKQILESDDDTVRIALQSNIAAFRESIQKNRNTPTKPKRVARSGVTKGKSIPGEAPAAKSVAG